MWSNGANYFTANMKTDSSEQALEALIMLQPTGMDGFASGTAGIVAVIGFAFDELLGESEAEENVS